MKKRSIRIICMTLIMVLLFQTLTYATENREYSEDIAYTDDMPSTPTSLKVYKTASGTVTISWKHYGYICEIFLKKDNGKWEKVATAEHYKIQKYKLKGLSNTATYKVRIRTRKEYGEKDLYSSFTKPVTVNMKRQVLPKDLRVKKQLILKVGNQKALPVRVAAGKNANLIKKAKYTVKNSKIVSVKNGVVKAKRKGSTTITTKVTLKSDLTRTFTTKVTVKRK